MAHGKELSRRMFAAIARGDVSTMRELCAPEVVLEEAGGTFRGIDEVGGHFESISTPFPDLAIIIENQVEEGDQVVTQIRFTGTQSAPMTTPDGVLPPSGRRVDLAGCAVHTYRDGRIVSHVGYYDQMAFLGQLGLLPEPAGR